MRGKLPLICLRKEKALLVKAYNKKVDFEGGRKFFTITKLSQSMKDNISAYLYISPFFIIFTVFGLFPILFTFYVSFKEWNILSSGEFIGLQNYIKLFTDDPLFWKSVGNTIILWIMSTAPQIFLALVIAFALNQKFLKGKQFYKLAVFIPYVTSVVAVGIIFSVIFGKQYGILNYLLSLIGIDPINWQGNTLAAQIAISIMVLWRWTGYNSIIFIAALQNIPNDLYEAATIDGASKFQQFLHITIPMIRPMIIFVVIVSTIGGMQLFTEPLLFLGQGGGSSAQGLTMSLYLYEEAFVRNNFGYASAIAVLLFLVILVFSLVNLLMTKQIKSVD